MLRNIRKTSIQSYYTMNLKKTDAMKLCILQILNVRKDGMTDREICQMFTEDAQKSLQPKVRRHELYKLGKIMCIGKRKCSVSGKNAMVWVKK